MKKVKLLICMILSLILVFSAREISFALKSEPTLIYDSRTRKFTYINVKSEDLFDSFKELMPGDKKQQSLIVNLDKLANNSNLYIRFNKEDIFLDKLNFKIYKDDEIIFDNKKDEDNYNKLINLYENNEKKIFSITFDLEVPTELSNELEEYTSNFKWDYIVEDAGNYIEAPQTFAKDNMIYYIVLMLVSLIVIIIIARTIKNDLKPEK